MTCPICDQKPANCDCTETERRQHREIEELRLTDEEREAIEWAAFEFDGLRPRNIQAAKRAATLRGLLERLK